MKGIVDRIEDNNQAVILIEEKNEQFTVPVEQLPPGANVNTYLEIVEQHGTYTIQGIDKAATENETAKTKDLMEKLRAKGKGSKFKRHE
ncbi:DUF3006 domain-containing protein [Oceanobacillus halotolerans]|uniref:DUF3006 domain-containing protein n=1 Tax=Oceanobacillus halotolerans TaxID=2663380 RepID=UPI0013D9D197|nr:DUF3006 domain-containing protein [Oceanobacillus halotolerans]